MTSVPKEQFKGATRKGIEDIRSAIADAQKLTTLAINVALEEHSETTTEFFHRSERAAELDWVNFRKHRERDRKSLIETPIILLGFVVLAGFVGILLQAYASTLEIAPNDVPPLTFMLGFSGLLAAYPFYGAVKELVRESRLGFTTYFKKQMRYRLNTAWAISSEAVYAARTSRSDDDLIEVSRVPFTAIQACVYADHEGLRTAYLYTKDGDTFGLADPMGPNCCGAANLADHVWRLTNK